MGNLALARGRDRPQRATIITCSPNGLVTELHDRMPVILPPSVWPIWLGEESVDRPETLKMALAPAPTRW
jgi:putative SOS response-associated peptidase YedK